MIRRLVAIGCIFLGASLAWTLLGSAIHSRTHSSDATLRTKVQGSWGAPQVQPPPAISYVETVKKREEYTDGGKQAFRLVEQVVRHTVPLAGSDIEVRLALDHRKKGLLWYATYVVDFSASYLLANPDSVPREIQVSLAFPARKAIYDEFVFLVEGKPWVSPPVSADGSMSARVHLAPGEKASLRVGYRSQGMDRWTYQFGAAVSEVRDFRLRMRTDFAAIDFPEDTISPTRKERIAEGWGLEWQYRRLLSGASIAMEMPQKLQPGPLAGEIAGFAPLSLFFFIVVMLSLALVRGIELHPMHFFFLSAAFFSFHLLFAYLADQLAVHAAFAIAAAVSLALVVSYLRLIFGNRFALLHAGGAQFLYLVLFSYAFFFKGLTGLAITIGAIVTLFLLMQMTARVRWREVFV